MLTKIKLPTKILAVLLTMLFIVEILPTQIMADAYSAYADKKQFVSDLINNPTDAAKDKEADILCEVTEKRDAYTKVYKKTDGTYTAVMSKLPLHFLENGEWEDIDNTLLKKNGVLSNSSNSFDVSFPEKMIENSDIQIEKNGSVISFAVNDISTSDAKVENNIAEKTSGIDEADAEISNNESKITYSDKKSNTDIQYVVTPNTVKENIIVSDASSVKESYSFDIGIGSMEYSLEKDGSVIFTENDETKFSIPAPVMMDSKLNVSYNIAVSVADNKDGTITLVYKPSQEWINSSDREFPINIDPVIVVQDNALNWVEDASVADDTNNSEARFRNGYDDPFGIAGEYSGATGEIFTRINTEAFSVLGEGMVITNATYVWGGVMASSGKLFLKELAQPCNLHTVTYDTKPSTIDSVIDYYTSPLVEGEDPSDQLAIHFDITEALYRWMNGYTNNGFALLADPGVGALVILNGSLTLFNHTETYSTILVLDYVYSNGYDNNFSYHSQSTNRAGTGYVNDFTRSLSVVRNDVELPGNIMPVSISSVYNTALTETLPVLFEDIENPYGVNWQNCYSRLLVRHNDVEFSYLTETGTCIDFIGSMDQDGNISFKDAHADNYGESGYSLELIEQLENLNLPSDYTGDYFEYLKLTRPDGYVERFNSYGQLISITNPDYPTQHIDIVYETGNESYKINYITDGVGRKFDYVYDSTTGLLSEIDCLTSAGAPINYGTTSSPLKISYTYNEDNFLTGATFADGKTVNYDYDTDTGALTEIIGIDGYKICYSYDNGKVETVTEKVEGFDDVYGNFINYTETSPTQISLSDNNGMTETYFFNQLGQVMYTVDNKGNYYFNSNIGNDTFFVNSYDYKPLTENLLRSPSFETSSGWSGTGYDIIEDTTARTGSKVAKLSANNTSTKSITQTVNVAPGGSYTVSAYIKKVADIDNSNGTFKINIKGYNASNVKKLEDDQSIDALTTDWQRFYATIDNSSNNYPLTKIIITISSTSSNTEILIDDVQLQGTLSPSDFNLIENGSFSNSDSGWTISGASSVESDSIYDRGVKALKFTGGADSANTALMQVNINGEKNDVFTVGGWFKGGFVKSENQNPLIDVLLEQSDTPTNFTEDRYAQIEVSYQYEEEDENNVPQTLTDTVVIPYLQYLTDWQFAANSFALKGDTSTLNILIRYEKNANPGFFTGFELTQDMDAVVFDDTEEQETSTCPCENCEEPNCPCTCVDEEHCTCVQCQRRNGETTQDTFGNITSTTAFDGVKSIVTSQAYSSDGNYLTSETDDLGNTTSYTVDSLNGIISAVTDPNGNTTNYTYNAYNLLTAVYTLNSQNEVESNVQYTYINDRLTAITHNGFTYNITYDIWGQMTEFAVGTQPIITYFYGITGHRERLTHVIYHHGTNTSVTNIDDNYVTIGNLVNAGDVVFEYTYNDDGKAETIYQCLMENNAVVPTEKYIFEYDSLGNVIRTTEVGVRIVETLDGKTTIRTPDGSSVIYTSYYDGDNLVEVIGGLIYTTTEYDSDYTTSTGITVQKSDYAVSDGRVVGTVTSSDWFGRTTQEVVKTESAIDNNSSNSFAAISTSFGYVDSNSSTSNRVSYITNRVTHGTDTSVQKKFYGFTYEYDANGNIIAEYKRGTSGNNTLLRSYSYDNLNQLVRSNEVGGNTYVYDYDVAGNITSIKEYFYTTDDVILDEPEDTKVFTYDNAWKDRLTSADGKTYTYDNVGNPVSIGSDTLVWEGRTLKSYTKGNKVFEYSYDENGLRHRKTVSENGVVKETYDYVWSDDKLISQKYTDVNGSYAAKFIYGSNGDIQGFIYDDTTYLYVKNLYGDIVAVINEEGKEAMKISYDVWGYPHAAVGGFNNGPLFNIINHISSFAYRGYCFDSDTELYYLQSRYYDPNICRFINNDSVEITIAMQGDINSVNLFAYCKNNPINNTDKSGAWIQYVAGAALGGTLSVVLYFVDCKLGGTSPVWWKALGQFAVGAASGALAATGVKLFGQVIGNVVLSLSSLIFSAKPIRQDELVIEVVSAIIVGIVAGFAGGPGIGHKNYLNSQTKRLIKRIARETSKAIVYFVKCNKTIYNQIFKAIIRSITAGALTKYGRQLLVR